MNREPLREQVRTDWHSETFEEALMALREHFDAIGFEVHVNHRVRSITLISRETSKALTLMETTGSHFDSENRLVLPHLARLDR